MRQNQRLRRPQGGIHWIERIVDELPEFKSAGKKERREIIYSISRRWGLRENTIQRQFAALLFLESRSFDPRTVDSGVTLAALEAAAKAINIDEAEGKKLLGEILLGNLTSRAVIARYRNIRFNNPIAMRNPNPARNPNIVEYYRPRAEGQHPGGRGSVLDSVWQQGTDFATANQYASAVASSNTLAKNHENAEVRPEFKLRPDYTGAHLVAKLASSLIAVKGDIEVNLKPHWECKRSSDLFSRFAALDSHERRIGSIFVLKETPLVKQDMQMAFIASIATALMQEDRVHAYYDGNSHMLIASMNSFVHAKGLAFEWFAFDTIRQADLQKSESILSSLVQFKS